MDHKIKHYAAMLYERALHESASIARNERLKAQQEMAARRGVADLAISGPEIQTMLKLFVQHIERCMEARLESYRQAYIEAKLDPTDEEFSEILTSVQETQKLQTSHSAQALHNFVKTRGADGDVTSNLTTSSAHGHDRVLMEWKVWRGQVQLTKTVRDDDREFARMAIEEARKSVPENDGRPHPAVGAVVVKNRQVLATAHRGEAEGNHAEYIALEKRLADAAVAGATVYTTLEPCTTRNHPKIPCAETLIERKVARVVIGMLDPDPRITGRGQRRLRTANIITDLFPHDLMKEVEELNREFTRKLEAATGAAGPSPRTEDRKTLDELLSILSQTGSIDFLRDQNFAGWSFDWQRLDGIECILDRRGAEYEFLDSELEELRQTFVGACQQLLTLLATETFPVGNGNRQAVPEEWESEQPERFERTVKQIHAAAGSVCSSFDQLVRTAREKLSL